MTLLVSMIRFRIHIGQAVHYFRCMADNNNTLVQCFQTFLKLCIYYSQYTDASKLANTNFGIIQFFCGGHFSLPRPKFHSQNLFSTKVSIYTQLNNFFTFLETTVIA